MKSKYIHEREKYVSKIIELCKAHQLNVFKDASLRVIEQCICSMSINFICCFGFRRMLPENVIKSAEKTALRTHFSMLTEYRGFAPVNWTIINEESRCGASLFYMDKEMDAGELVAQREVIISEQDSQIITADRLIKSIRVKLG